VTPDPHTPLVQTALAHSPADVQLFPSGIPEPLAHIPSVQVPLAQSPSALQVLSLGAPCPLPTQAPPWQTPLTHWALFVHSAPPGLRPSLVSPVDPQE
jgi:hypothetical protein